MRPALHGRSTYFSGRWDSPLNNHKRFSGIAGGKTTDEGPLTTERMKTWDEEVGAKTMAFIERQAKAGTPFFVWHNASRMHVFTHLKDESKGKSRAISSN